MPGQLKTLKDAIDSAQSLGPIRVAVADAAQGLVIKSLRRAHKMGIVEPLLIGDPYAIEEGCRDLNWDIKEEWLVAAPSDAAAAAAAVELVRTGRADTVMKGNIHTDVLMRALLDSQNGLRLPGRRVSHVFVTEISTRSKLLGITDAAINIAPDLDAKAQILQNAVDLFCLLGVSQPKVGVLSAIETVNSDIASTLDAACLTIMAKRGQIRGALVDGPLAFDNAVSTAAAKEKGIVSEVAGDVDVVLVPDLVSGNILAKNLGYFTGAVAAGVVVGLTVPVVLSSRADPPTGRLAALALASLMHHRTAKTQPVHVSEREAAFHCAPQPEHACCPTAG